MLVVLGLLLWRRFRVRETFQHDLRLLEHDAQRKSEALQRELAQLREAQEVYAAQTAQTPVTVATVSNILPATPTAVPPEQGARPARPVSDQPVTMPPSTPIPTIFQ